jgi:hypothetical protein
MSGTGSIQKRCSCPPAYSASGARLACKRNHGSWSFVVGVTDRGTGKRRQVRQSGFRTQDDAKAALAALAALVEQASKGTVPPRQRETFTSYAEQWLAALGAGPPDNRGHLPQRRERRRARVRRHPASRRATRRH